MICENNSDDKFKKLMKMQHKLIQKRLNKYNLYRGQHIILFMIYENPGITQKEIANMINISSATVSVSIKRLQNSKYIEKKLCPDDSRKTILYLSDLGKEIVDEIHFEMDSVHSVIYNEFSENEKEILNKLFDKMILNIEKEFVDEIH